MALVKSTATILCICTIACVIIRLILPEGRTRKTMNLIITGFLIIIMIAPIKNLFVKSSDFFVSTPDEARITKDYNNKVMSLTQENIRNSLITVLNQNGIMAQNVYVSLYTDKDSGIYIDLISIYLSKDSIEKSNEAVRITEEYFSVTPEIIIC